MTSRLDLLELWYEALAHPLGLAITVEPGREEPLIQKLYSVRAKAQDPSLTSLSLIFRAAGEIFIIHKEVPVENPPA